MSDEKKLSLEQWSVERVQQWMRGHGKAFEQYAQIIEDNQIDGHTLVHDLTSEPIQASGPISEPSMMIDGGD